MHVSTKKKKNCCARNVHATIKWWFNTAPFWAKCLNFIIFLCWILNQLTSYVHHKYRSLKKKNQVQWPFPILWYDLWRAMQYMLRESSIFFVTRNIHIYRSIQFIENYIWADQWNRNFFAWLFDACTFFKFIQKKQRIWTHESFVIRNYIFTCATATYNYKWYLFV